MYFFYSSKRRLFTITNWWAINPHSMVTPPIWCDVIQQPTTLFLLIDSIKGLVYNI